MMTFEKCQNYVKCHALGNFLLNKCLRDMFRVEFIGNSILLFVFTCYSYSLTSKSILEELVIKRTHL